MNEEQRKIIIRETFDKVSCDYDSNPLRFFSKSAKHMVSILSLNGDENVLDVATGTGNAALAIAECIPQGFVTGIDFSAGMLKQAREKAELRSIENVTFIETDMQAMDFTTDPFDVAVCAFGIFFVENMETQLSYIAKMVKPGGKIAICNFGEDYFNPLRSLMMTRLNTYDVQFPPQTWKRIAHESGCKELFEKAGIQSVRTESKNMGYFLSDENDWWKIIWNAGFRRLVSQLELSDLERFTSDHMQEIAALSTKDGIWLDIDVLYTTGFVPMP